VRLKARSIRVGLARGARHTRPVPTQPTAAMSDDVKHYRRDGGSHAAPALALPPRAHAQNDLWMVRASRREWHHPEDGLHPNLALRTAPLRSRVQRNSPATAWHSPRRRRAGSQSPRTATRCGGAQPLHPAAEHCTHPPHADPSHGTQPPSAATHQLGSPATALELCL
jgi:hypothetical protein